MSDSFTGSVFRVALARTRPGPSVVESFHLSISDDRERTERFIRRLYHAHKNWWFVDVVDFVDAPKRSPALLYSREIPTDAPRGLFAERYFDAPFSLPGNQDPYASNPRGFGRALRGSVENRRRELELERRARGLDVDDPWCDADASYEHYWARTLAATPTGYVEGVWFLSAAIDGDPASELDRELANDAARRDGEALAVIGPRPANTMAFPSTGLSLGQAFRHYPGGVDEYRSTIDDLSVWL